MSSDIRTETDAFPPRCECDQVCCTWCSIHGDTGDYEVRKAALIEQIADALDEMEHHMRAHVDAQKRVVQLRSEHDAIMQAERRRVSLIRFGTTDKR
ncbi:hypothetical protein [Mycobacteroides abscessus]|uniref:hypothetical protein n=1 Tax=Mycobacteroides abscessus TaxID=36809 RepID=UPI000927DB41|nr:hypothetical protein [Mycobacteroides abscessus]MBN7333087.1 hypothetical protein [Mycobacteroides abscessus subsp. abscessus]SHP47815.1 Uncharacterised protein [Mycobacteroides abscessus subsp. abscessus]SIE06616.1 Uncharacterised protein [Mycobacteroides abscessus subsp. abscessus]SIE19441.1 Uncharacterised protein [Mycobacteroides abscessus subsp. abscessus]SIF97216.1 Uncharacterised protein [Mycobacteroides abscessus subsp. abscessus]